MYSPGDGESQNLFSKELRPSRLEAGVDREAQTQNNNLKRNWEPEALAVSDFQYDVVPHTLFSRM
jgi:hypothetical protein